ncbi:MAG: hypothetical protein ACE366_19700 [Bradymonadia bacterium]
MHTSGSFKRRLSLIAAVLGVTLVGPSLMGHQQAEAQFEGLVDAPDVQEAEAKKKVPKTGISSVLGLLDWGCSHNDVLGKVKAEIDERYAESLRQTTDVFEIDRIRKRKQQEYARVEKTYVQFGAQRTGYESSLIAKDFQKNSGESVVRVDDASAQRYYFFKDDRLWKVLVAYNNSITRKVSFEKFARQVRKKYGRPVKMDWYTPKGGTKTIRAATWSDDMTQLKVEDRSAFFGSFVMTFLSKDEGVALEANRVGTPASPANIADDPAVASALADITGGVMNEETDIVDQITGETPEVDLNAGRKRYESVSRVSGKPVVDGPKRRSRKGRKGAKKATKKAEETKPAAEEPFIIY